MTDPSGYAKKSTANGDTRSGLRLRLRIAVPDRAAAGDPPQHLTCGKFNSRSLVAGSSYLGRPLPWPNTDAASLSACSLVAPILGAGFGAENITKRDFVVPLNLAGQLHRQLQAMPPGSAITGFTVDGETAP